LCQKIKAITSFGHFIVPVLQLERLVTHSCRMHGTNLPSRQHPRRCCKVAQTKKGMNYKTWPLIFVPWFIRM